MWRTFGFYHYLYIVILNLDFGVLSDSDDLDFNTIHLDSWRSKIQLHLMSVQDSVFHNLIAGLI